MTELPCLNRRTLLHTLGAVGVTTIGAGVLVACSDTSSDSGSDTGSGTDSTASGGEAAASGGTVPVSEVPVGQARVVDLDGTTVVVARTAEDTAVAYSAACTHAGVMVEESDGMTVSCPAHGSQFDATDGSATEGPATDPLAALTATVEGDQIVIAA